MEEAGFYKFTNGEWAYAPEGIILPYTTTPTTDPVVLAEYGWYWYDSPPEMPI